MSIRKWIKTRRLNRWKKLSLGYDKPIPKPTPQVLKQIDELRKSFRQFSKWDDSEGPESAKEWNSNMNRLRELVLTGNPLEFLRWDVILQTMFVAYAEYVEPEIKYLQKHPLWSSRWKKAIQENCIGHPVSNWKRPESSSNLIHHAHHVCRFEDATNKKVGDYEYIVEFGGGYGSLCRLMFNLGFNGKYFIYDLPAFSELQKFYLSALGFQVQKALQNKDNSQIFCISDIERFRQALSQVDLNKALFVATWSISETPLDFRKEIFPFLTDFNSYLIAYQDDFREVDNLYFFREWQDSLNNINWIDSRIDIMKHHHRYLFGTRKPTEV